MIKAFFVHSNFTDEVKVYQCSLSFWVIYPWCIKNCVQRLQTFPFAYISQSHAFSPELSNLTNLALFRCSPDARYVLRASATFPTYQC